MTNSCHGTWFSPINKRQYGALLTLTVKINKAYDFTNDISGTTGKYGLGMDVQLTSNASIWGEANYLKGNNVESPVTGTVGFKINF
nr:autotransporter outer membrane beta-barrel domain-containing protein [Escherichia coli]